MKLRPDDKEVREIQAIDDSCSFVVDFYWRRDNDLTTDKILLFSEGFFPYILKDYE